MPETRTPDTETGSRRAVAEDAGATESALDRVEHELGRADAQSEKIERDLRRTMDELERDDVQAIDPQALGRLFSDLAKQCHKINNPLTSIMGRAQMMEMKVGQDSDEQLTKSVAVIQDSTKRVAALIQELANLVCQAKKEFVESYDSNSGSR